MSRPDAANLTGSYPGLVPLLDLLVEVVPSLQAVYLFGSEASGRASTESDIDLGLLAEAPLPPEVCSELAADLARRAGREVDLVDLRRIDPILAFQILFRGERLLVRDSHAQALWEMSALSRYQDWKLCRRENERALLRESLA